MIKIIFILFSACLLIYSQGNIPDDIRIRSYVTDKTNTLSPSEISKLEKKLSDFEKETSNQIVVWLEPSLEGYSLEERSYEIAEKNGIGQKGKNNGVLLYVAKLNRKIRIEVGYGLEGVLTDALCSYIIRNEIAPRFRKELYYEGIDRGTDVIIQATRGEFKNQEEMSQPDMICCFPMPVFFFIVLIMVIILINFFMKIGGAITGNNWWYTSGGKGWSSGSSWGVGFSGGGGSFGGGGASGGW